METTRETTIDTATTFSVYMCVLLLMIVLGRVQEIFLFLAPFRPALLATGLTVALCIFNRRLTNLELWRAKETKLVLLFWFIGFVSTFFSVWPGGAFKEWKTEFTINLLLFLCLMANMKTKKDIIVLNRAVIASVLIMALAVIISPESTLSSRQSTTATYDPNDLAMLLVTTAPLALAFFFCGTKVSKIIYGGILVVMLLVLLRTGSRGGFVGLVVLGGIFFFTPSSRVSFAKKALLIAVACILVISFAPEALWERFQAIFAGTDYNLQASDEGAFGRLEIWKTGAKLLADHPVFGTGAGQFSNSMGMKYGQYYYKTAHNSYLQVAVELGFPGLAVFLAFLWKIWKNLKKAKAATLRNLETDYLKNLSIFSFFSLVGYLICGMFLSQAYSVIVPFFLANSCALERQTTEESY